jgi:hypothetical protein
MTAKPYTLLTVRMPPDLHIVLEAISVAKGETVSTIVRDMVRRAAVDARRVDQTVPQILASGSPVTVKDFK